MKKKKNLNTFMKELINQLEEEGRYGTAHVHESTLKSFSKFCKNETISFSMLNRANLKEYECYLRRDKKSWNTVSTYMRVLRSIYNKAADEKLVPYNPRLFNHVYTGVESNTKRALEPEEMNQLLNSVPAKELTEELILCRVWSILMFQLQGMPFVDLAHLQKNDIQGSTITYLRQKTSTRIVVEVPPSAMELIQKYQSTDNDSPYLLPILDGKKTGKNKYKEYQLALRTMNYNLNRLATKCGITTPVSSYTTRHTWATLAKYCNFSEQLICDALGHSSVKVTETYLKSFKREEISNANKKIISYVSNNGKKGLLAHK